MNRLFGFGKEIPYLNRLNNRIFYSTVIIILTFNIFVTFSLHINKTIKENLNNSFIVADLQNTLEQNQKNEIEKYLLKLSGVKSTRFIDKKESFKNLQRELNISIPKATNPLPDSILVYLKADADINKIQGIIEEKEEIKETYKNEEYINYSENKSLTWGAIQIASALISVLLGIVSILIFNLGVGLEFLNNINIEQDNKKSIYKSKLRKLLQYTAGTIVGILMFFNLYLVFRKYSFLSEYNFTLLSFKEILIWNVLAIVFLNFLVWILPISILKIEDGGEYE